MKKFLHVLCIIALSASGASMAQDTVSISNMDSRCVTVQMDQKLREKFPELGSSERFEDWIDIAKASLTSQNFVTTTIPVVFHVVHDNDSVGSGDNLSQTYLNAQITQLNDDFGKITGSSGDNSHPDGADTEVQFVLDTINRIDRNSMGWSAPPYSTTYVENTIKGDSSWDPESYMNVWVCGMSGGILGYAQFPSQSGLGGFDPDEGPASTDGVVVLTSSVGSTSTPYPGGGSYNMGRTLTHEVGHYLGLRHIWGDGGCSVDDYVTDTPESDGANYGCPSTSSCGTTDMVENYMDYTDDTCMNIFTYGQKARIQTVIADALRRQYNGGGGGGGNQTPSAGFTVASNLLSVDFSDTSSDSDGSVVSWSWSFGDSSNSTAQNPSHIYAASGNYSVSLTVTDDEGATNSTSQNVVVSDGTPGGAELINGVPVSGVNVSLENWEHFYIDVPAGATNVSATLASSNGDADLYVRYGQEGNTSDYDCRSYTATSNESCSIDSPNGGLYYVSIYAYSAFTDLTVTATYTTGGVNEAPTANFSHTTSELAASFTDSSSDSDGSITGWAWNFGDGNTSSNQNPTHTYAADGTYTVSLTVTDDGGANDTSSSSVTVLTSDPGNGELTSGVTVTGLNGAADDWEMFYIDVPANATDLTVVTAGGTGDADLYVRFGSEPTTADYDCRGFTGDSNESCSSTNPAQGRWYVGVRSYSATSGVSLTATVTTGGGGGCDNTDTHSNLGESADDWFYTTVNVPACATNLTVTMSGGTGDADLHTNFGSQPTATTYNCRPYSAGNNEECVEANPAAGVWHIGIRAYSTFSGATLTVTYD